MAFMHVPSRSSFVTPEMAVRTRIKAPAPAAPSKTPPRPKPATYMASAFLPEMVITGAQGSRGSMFSPRRKAGGTNAASSHIGANDDARTASPSQSQQSINKTIPTRPRTAPLNDSHSTLDIHSKYASGPSQTDTRVAPERVQPKSDNQELKRDGWYDEVYVKGSNVTQKISPHPHSEVPHWFGYSLQALDREMFLTSLLFVGEGSVHGTWAHTPDRPGSIPPPKRVLDLGCGAHSIWSVLTATEPGWEQTRFLGLDVVPPTLATAHLPPEVADRIEYLQHNFLTPLPFENGTFDCVRLAFCGGSIPEPAWGSLIEEATRVLANEGILEILDESLNILRKRPPRRGSLDSTSTSASSKRPPSASDPHKFVDDCVNTILDRRFINPHVLRMIPAQMCMNLSHVQSTGALTVQCLSAPKKSPPSVPTIPVQSTPAKHDSSPNADGQESPEAINLSVLPPLFPFSGSLITKTTPIAVPRFDRVLVALEADRIDACSYKLAHEATMRRVKRQEERRQHEIAVELLFDPSTPSRNFPKNSIVQQANSSPLRTSKMRSDLIDQLHSYCNDLRAKADLASVLRDENEGWGWVCKMDQQALKNQIENLPLLEERIDFFKHELMEALERERRGDESIQEGWDSASIELGLAHAKFAKKEAETEIKELERRLGLNKKDVVEEGELGHLELGCFVGIKKDPSVMS